MKTKTPENHIEKLPGDEARIAGRRITVRDVVVWHEHEGLSAPEIAATHDVRLSDVYAALTYYLDHRDEIDRAMARDKALVAELRNLPSVLPLEGPRPRPST